MDPGGGRNAIMDPEDVVSEWATIDDPDRICAGWSFSCGIRLDGTLVCWGADDQDQSSPPQDEVFVRLACGGAGGCAITENGELRCWGSDAFGQAQPPEGEFQEIACGEAHCCGIDVEDSLQCWGAGSPEDENTGMPHVYQSSPPAGFYRGVTTANAHGCAIDLATDEAVCWGGGGEGGDCFPPRSALCGQTVPPRGAQFEQLAAGFTHTCGITLEGKLVCWGKGKQEGSCDPYSGGLDYDCGQSVNMEGTFLRLSAGDFHTCAIDDAFELHCQGWDVAGVGMEPAGLYAQIAAGAEHSCAIHRSGAPACWGNPTGGATTVSEFPGSQ